MKNSYQETHKSARPSRIDKFIPAIVFVGSFLAATALWYGSGKWVESASAVKVDSVSWAGTFSLWNSQGEKASPVAAETWLSELGGKVITDPVKIDKSQMSEGRVTIKFMRPKDKQVFLHIRWRNSDNTVKEGSVLIQ